MAPGSLTVIPPATIYVVNPTEPTKLTKVEVAKTTDFSVSSQLTPEQAKLASEMQFLDTLIK